MYNDICNNATESSVFFLTFEKKAVILFKNNFIKKINTFGFWTTIYN